MTKQNELETILTLKGSAFWKAYLEWLYTLDNRQYMTYSAVYRRHRRDEYGLKRELREMTKEKA